LNNLISNIKYDNNNIVTTMNIKFTRKNKTFQKNAILIVAPFMYEILVFFKEIKNKYGNLFIDFFKYFEKNYINSTQYGYLSFNFNSLINTNVSDELKFYTNNITESFNRTLNSKYIGGVKSFYYFYKALFDILEHYKNPNIYKPRYISITRALAYYCKNNMNLNLIKFKDIDKIKLEYKNYLIKNKNLNKTLSEEKSEYSSDYSDIMDIKNDNIYDNDILDSDYNNYNSSSLEDNNNYNIKNENNSNSNSEDEKNNKNSIFKDTKEIKSNKNKNSKINKSKKKNCKRYKKNMIIHINKIYILDTDFHSFKYSYFNILSNDMKIKTFKINCNFINQYNMCLKELNTVNLFDTMNMPKIANDVKFENNLINIDNEKNIFNNQNLDYNKERNDFKLKLRKIKLNKLILKKRNLYDFMIEKN